MLESKLRDSKEAHSRKAGGGLLRAILAFSCTMLCILLTYCIICVHYDVKTLKLEVDRLSAAADDATPLREYIDAVVAGDVSALRHEVDKLTVTLGDVSTLRKDVDKLMVILGDVSALKQDVDKLMVILGDVSALRQDVDKLMVTLGDVSTLRKDVDKLMVILGDVSTLRQDVDTLTVALDDASARSAEASSRTTEQEDVDSATVDDISTSQQGQGRLGVASHLPNADKLNAAESDIVTLRQHNRLTYVAVDDVTTRLDNIETALGGILEADAYESDTGIQRVNLTGFHTLGDADKRGDVSRPTEDVKRAKNNYDGHRINSPTLKRLKRSAVDTVSSHGKRGLHRKRKGLQKKGRNIEPKIKVLHMEGHMDVGLWQNMSKSKDLTPSPTYRGLITRRGFIPHANLFDFWHLAPWLNKRSLGFVKISNSGSVEIRESGIYFIYAQIMYNDNPVRHSFGVYVDDHIAFLCLSNAHFLRLDNGDQMNETEPTTCHTSGVLHLRKGQLVSIRNKFKFRGQSSLLTQPHQSFWGMVKLGDM